ncbi:MAG: hypothetical protein COX62_02205 [Deltaproteobacteria bacterium CG_4_10_14_0_2_um_filter_43_8]|nr:MAG: hypothetical protein COV43_01895 [Deltaproteobacteria bacterium CG11_big_fil_rev_8_21_14_0_20_42_23]PJA21532.1 MAG: hypothetical protein COX62_02205 [Deltaproteobacteria bacterium CG_4_10_14_0_2_um_filter_43_8]PJC63986.1 MAG: hypothetical protein CO021_06660 [Deltaproteobacteria bacterium CG_4_9_14_0_2_um_filter_42_21]
MKLKEFKINFEAVRFDNLYAKYLALTSREQSIALAGIGVALFFILFLPITLASGSLSSLTKSIETSKNDLKQVIRKIDHYNETKANLDAVEQSLFGRFDSSIATTLESLATRAGIAERIDSLKEKKKPSSDLVEEAAVEVRIRKVSLKDLISFLFEIENHPTKNLHLENLEVKTRYKKQNELDASFTVSTFKLKEKDEL